MSAEFPADSISSNMIKPVAPNCPVEVFRWGGQPDHHLSDVDHRHSFDEILLINRGGGTHGINGQTYSLESGAVHILPAGTSHLLLRTDLCDGGTVLFQKQYVLDEPYLPFKQLDFYQLNHPVLKLPEHTFSEIWLTYEHLLYESRQQQHYYRKPLILSWLNALFIKISVQFKHLEISLIPTQRNPYVQQFLALVSQYYAQEKRVGFYASQLFISPKYLHELCAEQMGIGPQEIIANRIASEALSLLSMGQLSVKEIAIRLGFNDTDYFSRFIRKKTNKTPTEWIRNRDLS